MRKTFSKRGVNNWKSKDTRTSPDAIFTVTPRGEIKTEKKVADKLIVEQSLPEDEQQARKDRKDRYKPESGS